MKVPKILIISFLVILFIYGCTPKTISGTYSTKLPKKVQCNTEAVLFLYNDSTFHYMELKGTCWSNVEFESAGKWTLNNDSLTLNSSQLATDTMRLFSQKEIKYKQFSNHHFIIKGKKLIDTTQTNIGLRVLRKTSSETEFRLMCGNEY